MARREEVLNSRAVVPEHVVQRAFDAETLMLNLGTGRYHGVDATGARTLELLSETGGDVRASIDRLASEHGLVADDITDDLLDFLAQLVDRRLLELRPR
jgi:hypothetical protein